MVYGATADIHIAADRSIARSKRGERAKKQASERSLSLAHSRSFKHIHTAAETERARIGYQNEKKESRDQRHGDKDRDKHRNRSFGRSILNIGYHSETKLHAYNVFLTKKEYAHCSNTFTTYSSSYSFQLFAVLCICVCARALFAGGSSIERP